MRFSFWTNLNQPWADVVDGVSHVERTGWDGVYVADHFMADAGGPFPADQPHFEATATLAAAAVMVPAVVGLGFLAGRRGDAQQAVGAPPETTILMATSTTMQPSAGPASYRCQGEVADDGVFTYYQYCEYIDPAAPPMTTTFVTIPQPTTTTIDPQLPDGTLVVIDATGGLPVQEILESRGVAFSEVMPARRVVAQTMIMPIGDDTTQAERLAELVPVGGFDTWDSTLIDGPVPDGDPLADVQREPVVRVKHGIILDIASPTDVQGVCVAPGDGAVPDAGVFRDADVAHHHGRLGHPRAVRHLRLTFTQFIDRHSPLRCRQKLQL